MTRLYLDTEFNGFGGELISLALVPADKAVAPFYVAVPWSGPTDPWVDRHVVPYINIPLTPRAEAARLLAIFLRKSETHGIIADWPTDFEHLLALLITGPGQMVAAPDFTMEFRRLAGFNTAAASRLPHNALADAEALRDHCERINNPTETP